MKSLYNLSVFNFAFIALAFLIFTPAQAQQRTFFNGGFEQNDPQGPGTPAFEFFDDDDVPEWTSTTNLIELWDDNFNSTPAYEGVVFAEMNAKQPGSIFQEVCLIGGETLEWFFAHRARPGGSGVNPQTAILEIADLSGTQQQLLATQVTSVADGWLTNSGSTQFNFPTGIYRAQFKTTNPGSYGNFLDALTLNIASFAVILDDGAALERVGDNIPTVIVNGIVNVATTIPINVTGGTATLGDDFTQTSASLLIPAGLYLNQELPLPFIINDNTIVEPDETILIELGTPSSAEVIYQNTACDGSPPKTTASYTIINDDTTVDANKTVQMFNDGAGNAYAIPGNDVIYTISVSNTGPVDVDSDTIFLVDSLPTEITFYNGDIDNAGPETNPVSFSTTAPNLTFDYAANVGFSRSTTKPTDLASCNDVPTGGYDPTIRYICFAPQGTFDAGDPDFDFAVNFRARIK